MDLDKFLKSQTFKTGAFVLLVLFVLLIVFKIGFIHGHKKAISPHKYGNNYSQTYRGTFLGHYRGTVSKDLQSKLIFKKRLIEGKVILDSETGEESVEEDATQ